MEEKKRQEDLRTGGIVVVPSSYAVTTIMNYSDRDVSQTITRTVIPSLVSSKDDIYHVRNVLTASDGQQIRVDSYFSRIACDE